MELKDRVLQTLKKSYEPLKSGDLAKLLEVDSKEVSKAIKELKKEEKIDSPKRCYYSAK